MYVKSFFEKHMNLAGPNDLGVMSLNLQYYASYPTDEEAAREKLMQVIHEGAMPPDVICVQEGIASKDVLASTGYCSR